MKALKHQKIFLFFIILSLYSVKAFTDIEMNYKVRPIQLIAINKTTKERIPNIRIYYKLRSYAYSDKYLGIIPRFETRIDTRNLILKEFTTDKNGEVNIAIDTVALKSRERIYDEEIAINLDIDAAKIPDTQYPERVQRFFDYFNPHEIAYSEFLYNPNQLYSGYYIQSSEYEINPSDVGGTVRKKFDILWNSKGLVKTKDTIVIELRKK